MRFRLRIEDRATGLIPGNKIKTGDPVCAGGTGLGVSGRGKGYYGALWQSRRALGKRGLGAGSAASERTVEWRSSDGPQFKGIRSIRAGQHLGDVDW